MNRQPRRALSTDLSHRPLPCSLLGRVLALQMLVASVGLGAGAASAQDSRPAAPPTSIGRTAPQAAPEKGRAPAAEKGQPATRDGARMSTSRQQREANPTNATELALNAAQTPPALENPTFVRFDPPELDYGDMAAGVAETMTVKIINTSDEPILITRIVPGCGCTTTNWTKDPIPPGGSGSAEFTLKPPDRQGIDVHKKATIQFEGKPPVTYSLQGKVAEWIRVSPDMIDAPAAEEANDGKIELTSIDGTEFRIVGANPPIVDGIEGESATKHVVSIDWAKWIESGRSPKLSIVTDHPKATTLSVIVKRSLRDLRQPQAPQPTRVDRTESTTPLIQAVKTGDLSTTRLLLASGADVDAIDVVGGGRTALHWAVKENRKELIPMLLDAKATIDANDRVGKTPLSLACEGKDLEIVRMLIERGANVNSRDQIGGSPVLWAAGLGTPEMVTLLVSKGADVNVIDVNGLSPLLWAAGIGGSETVAVLIKAGAKIDVADRITGDTALMRAARSGRPESLKALLEAKAQIEARNQVGMTPFMLAAASGSVDKIKLLKEAGADVSAKDVKGWNALDHARNRVDADRAAVIEYVAALVPESGATTATAKGPEAPKTPQPAARPIGPAGSQGQ